MSDLPETGGPGRRSSKRDRDVPECPRCPGSAISGPLCPQCAAIARVNRPVRDRRAWRDRQVADAIERLQRSARLYQKLVRFSG